MITERVRVARPSPHVWSQEPHADHWETVQSRSSEVQDVAWGVLYSQFRQDLQLNLASSFWYLPSGQP